MRRVAVIGGGAAGLAAAVTAARSGAEVTLFERNPRPGKKLLRTGNGKCNFTNLTLSADRYHSADPAFIRGIMDRFSPSDALVFFEALGIFPLMRNGYVYPRSEQASDVAEALIRAGERAGVRFHTDAFVSGLTKTKEGFRIKTEYGDFPAEAVILSTGGKAAPKTGSDGFGMKLAVRLGHTMMEPYPALVPLLSDDPFFRQITGVRTNGEIRLLIDGQETAGETGELQFTEQGLSGIPVFQLSARAARALDGGKRVTAVIDFFPELSETEKHALLDGRTDVDGLLPSRLGVLLKNSGAFRQLTDLHIRIEKTAGFDRAQISGGGINVSEVDPQTLESRLVPQLYFAGELLDADGPCGGYNLHFAWATGVLAGFAAAGAEPVFPGPSPGQLARWAKSERADRRA